MLAQMLLIQIKLIVFPNSLTMFSPQLFPYILAVSMIKATLEHRVIEQPTENGWLLCFHGHFYLPNKF